jgi:2-dehydro-3-deoxygalactonokinase
MTGEAHEPAAFAQGLGYARAGPGGLLAQLFSVRTLGLLEQVPASGLASYLSGLLIGHEIKDATSRLAAAPLTDGITILGAHALAERYAEALASFGLPAQTGPADVVARGHWRIARAAGLVP